MKKALVCIASAIMIISAFSGCHLFGEDTNILTYYTPTPLPGTQESEVSATSEPKIEYNRLSVEVPTNSLNSLIKENIPSGTSQVILVTVTEDGEQLYCLESMERGWKVVYGPFECNIGRNGMGKTREGDGKTPEGVFELGSAFGQGGAPEGSNWPWRETSETDVWVEDSNSKYYNQYVDSASVERDWGNFEKLLITKYRTAIEVKYNSDNIPGLGSAIFLHVWGNANDTTGGCTSMEETTIRTLLKWLRPEAAPRLFQTTYISQLPIGFCYIKDFAPEVTYDIRLAGEDNILGRQFNEYYSPVGIASVEMAKRLDKASILLKEAGLKLLVYDSYRPQTAVNAIVDWIGDPSDLDMKETLYPNTDKSEMDNMFFAAQGPYSRGAAADVSIVDKSGRELDMGTQYQYIDESSRYGWKGLNDVQANNRELLRDIMLQSGLSANDTFWWSFYMEDEPFADLYFDFYVQ